MTISGWLDSLRRDLELSRRVLAVALMASYVPARRAACIDASAALRES